MIHAIFGAAKLAKSKHSLKPHNSERMEPRGLGCDINIKKYILPAQLHITDRSRTDILEVIIQQHPGMVACIYELRVHRIKSKALLLLHWNFAGTRPLYLGASFLSVRLCVNIYPFDPISI